MLKKIIGVTLAAIAASGVLLVGGPSQTAVAASDCGTTEQNVDYCTHSWGSDTVTVKRNVFAHEVWAEVTNNRMVWLNYSKDDGKDWGQPIAMRPGNTWKVNDVYTGYPWRACATAADGSIKCTRGV